MLCTCLLDHASSHVRLRACSDYGNSIHIGDDWQDGDKAGVSTIVSSPNGRSGSDNETVMVKLWDANQKTGQRSQGIGS